MTLSVSLSRWIQFTCLTLFLAASLTPPADAGSRRKRDSSAGNSAPVISGVPAETVAPGSTYVFQPTASDADGDSLRFRIRNLPAWASFSSRDGRLSGKPGAGDAGTYSNIRILVTDGIATTALPAFDISVGSATGGNGSVALSWLAPTSRSDGSPIAPSELSGYTVHYGPAPGKYTSFISIDDPFTTAVTVTDLPAGTYYFALTAVDNKGLQSAYSGVVTRQVQ